MSTAAINQQLFDRLSSVFGEVKIHNQGEPFSGQLGKRSFMVPGLGGTYVVIHNPGEYYAVCCPICGDTRHRLWINHRWNTGFKGVSLKHLVRCYNENCDELPDFRSTLSGLIDPGSIVSCVREGVLESRPEVYDYPGEVSRISDLPPDHPVVKYLQDERKFNIKILDDDWGIRWVTKPSHKNVFDSNRLVIPIYTEENGMVKMSGWQTRYFNPINRSPVPPNKRTPKYLTTGKASQMVYNFHRAKQSGLLVICEGVFGAIRVGVEHGVCTFGKSLSKAQADLIENRFLATGGKVVFAYDPDLSSKNWKKISDRVATWKDVRYMGFPQGVDIADYSDEEVAVVMKQLKGEDAT